MPERGGRHAIITQAGLDGPRVFTFLRAMPIRMRLPKLLTMSSLCPRALAALLLIGACARLPAQVIPVSLYGWMDQYSVNTENNFVGDEACVPTSSVNAMTYLQNIDPDYFGTSLTGSNYTTWHATDDLLISPQYMNTTVGEGTYYNVFVYAINQYITQTMGFTNTLFSGMFPTDNWDSSYPQPSYITDGRPTESFLADALASNDAVLLSIEYSNGNGHELLANGISWNSTTDTGTLYFVDPLDPSQTYDGGYPSGTAKETTGNLSLDDNGDLRMTYDQYQGALPYQPGNYTDYTVSFYGALAIGVPEPAATLLIAFTGLAALALRRFSLVPACFRRR
jgi:hypothetical protein